MSLCECFFRGAGRGLSRKNKTVVVFLQYVLYPAVWFSQIWLKEHKQLLWKIKTKSFIQVWKTTIAPGGGGTDLERGYGDVRP